MEKEERRLELQRKLMKIKKEYSDIISGIGFSINWKNDRIPKSMLESVENKPKRANKENKKSQ
jgi:hypothetical protein